MLLLLMQMEMSMKEFNTSNYIDDLLGGVMGEFTTTPLNKIRILMLIIIMSLL